MICKEVFGMSVIIRAHFDGKSIVPDSQLDLPADQALEVELHLISPAGTTPEAPQESIAAKPDITRLRFFGMWADREDMADSAKWVRKKREKWSIGRRTPAFLLALLILALAGCRNAKPPASTTAAGQETAKPMRATQPMGKGAELYSWKPPGEDWHFSLLPGTNRNKSLAEITDPQNTYIGVENLKRELSGLAVGEWVTWFPMASGRSGHPAWGATRTDAPPTEMVDDLVQYCKSLRVTLNAHPCSELAAPSH
jgi:hypothetical protein